MRSRDLNTWRTLWADERGGAVMLVAPMIVALVGAAAIGVDAMHAFTTHEQLRTAAEAAATVAVSELPNQSDALSAALEFGGDNLPEIATGAVIANNQVEFGHWNTATKSFEPGTSPVNASRVTASLTESKGNAMPTWFGGVIGTSLLDVGASAVAAASGEGIPCILALDPTGSKALTLKSNAVNDLPNCEVHVRSTASDGYFTDSNAVSSAERHCVVGNYSEMSNSEITPQPETGCDAADDPFEDIAEPSVGGCDYNNKFVDFQPVTLSPGVYCGGLNIKNNSIVTFSPGVYVIKDGKFTIDSNSVVTGDGVGFFLTGSSALLEFKSNTSVSLKAAHSGPMRGMLFFQDRDFGGEHKFDSNTKDVLEGGLYFPEGTFTSDSNTKMASSSTCMMLVAKRIVFDSNAGVDMTSNYPECPWLPGGVATKNTRIVG